jgi:hypothetical protein
MHSAFQDFFAGGINCRGRTMEAKRCPMCQKSMVIVGSGRAVDRSVTFVPSGIQPSVFEPGVPPTWNACLACGHLWASVAPQSLRAFIAARGSELLKQHVDQLDRGPAYDLPDFLKARQAAEKVAEIDGLILAGRQTEATRRYRELTRATWDRALETMRGWRNLKRPEKLALLGWAPDEKASAVISEANGHPMADHWLDAVPVRSRPGRGPVEE